MKKYDLVIPVIAEDVEKVFCHYNDLIEKLPIKGIVFIGNNRVRDCLENNYKRGIWKFVFEDDLVPYSQVKRIMENRNPNSGKKIGWYLQQFLKMKYACICQDEYYLVWDGDTIPLKTVTLLEEEKAVFDMKTEYHKPYFRTIHKILNLEKCETRSFIAEHMLFNTDIMKCMIKDIETMSGNIKSFYEVILDAVECEQLSASGFSEYETYGTYVMSKFPDEYILRDWHSLRNGGIYYIYENLDDTEKKWLSKSFDAISFEDWDTYDVNLSKKIQNPFLRIFCSPETVIQIYSSGLKIAIKSVIKRQLGISDCRYKHE